MTELFLRLLFSLFLNSFVCFIAIHFLNRICGKHIVSDKTFYAVAIIGVLFTTLVNRINISSYNIDLVAGASVVIFLAFLYANRIWVKLMFSFLFIVLAGISQIVAVMIVSIATNNNLYELYNKPFVFIIITLISVVLLWSLCEIVAKLQKHKENEIPTKISAFLLTVPVASLVMLIIIFNWYLNNGAQAKSALLMELSALIGILYINFIVFYMFDQISGLLQERREKEILKKQVDMQSKHYQRLEEYQSEVRGIRHDMKNKLLTLNQIINEYGIEQAQDFIASMIDNVSNVSKIVDTGNPGIDTVLNIKIDEAVKHEIDVTTDIIIPQGLKLSFERAAVLFGNLLDNSIEACICSNDRHISIKMNVINGALYLSISNPAKRGMLLTRKSDKLNHGIGLKNVALLIKEFDGMMKIENGNDFFSVKIVLYGL